MPRRRSWQPEPDGMLVHGQPERYAEVYEEPKPDAGHYGVVRLASGEDGVRLRLGEAGVDVRASELLG